MEIITAEAQKKCAFCVQGAVSKQMLLQESSERKERTDVMWVEFPAPPIIGCIITADSTSRYLGKFGIFLWRIYLARFFEG